MTKFIEVVTKLLLIVVVAQILYSLFCVGIALCRERQLGNDINAWKAARDFKPVCVEDKLSFQYTGGYPLRILYVTNRSCKLVSDGKRYITIYKSKDKSKE